MKRFEKTVSPSLVLVLMALWLLLNQTLAPAQIALGSALALGLAWAASTLRPLALRLRRFDLALHLALVVLAEIVRSNVAVGRLVLGLSGHRRIHSGFVNIPLELRDPHGLAALAMIITATPGTVWAGLSDDGSVLTLHVLDLVDEEQWTQLIKHRYELPLMRVFE